MVRRVSKTIPTSEEAIALKTRLAEYELIIDEDLKARSQKLDQDLRDLRKRPNDIVSSF